MKKTFDNRVLYGQLDDGGQSCQKIAFFQLRCHKFVE